MATTLDKIERAMTLPSDLRAELADLLVQSIEAESLSSIDRAWLAEGRRRRDQPRAGEAETIPGEAAMRKVRESLRR